MVIETILQLYLALLVVMTLHEFGHLPRKIKFHWGIIPKAAAMQSLIRWGGLAVNVVIASLVFYYRPESTFLQFVGLIAWAHFIIYAILGSIIPEPKESEVNVKTYVFDDVPNEQAFYYISGAIVIFMIMYKYYFTISGGIF